MRRLIAGCVVTAAVYVPLALWVDSRVSPSTPWVILLGGITAAVLAATMLVSTRGWSLRAVGLFLFLVGVAVLLLGGYAGYRWDVLDPHTEYVNDGIIALWIIGCPLALLGGVLYAIGGDTPAGDE